MQEILDTFFVEGDILATCCGMFVLFVGFVMLLDAVYVIKNIARSTM